MPVLVKPGVEFKVIAPQGFTILAAIHQVAGDFDMDLTITSGTDGVHTPGGPHERGEAFDLRSRYLSQSKKDSVVEILKGVLGEKFTVLLEDRDGINEHIHIQPRKAGS